MSAVDLTGGPRRSARAVVLVQELRDLWLGGRALALSFGFSVLVSVIAYLAAANKTLNFLEHREAVSLTLQVAIAVGTLLALIVAADAVSGERERGTLEALLLTPSPRSALVGGKLLAALSLWFVAFVITVPYVWFLARGAGVIGDAIATGVVVGTLLAVFLASLGMLISVLASTNRVSLSVSLLILLALFAPTQLPTGAKSGWFGDLLQRVNPITSGEHFVGQIVINGHSWSSQAGWLISPALGAMLFAVLALVLGARHLQLRGGASR